MKEELLKSVAQPVQIFYAPFLLFVINLVISFVFMLAALFFGQGVYILIVVFLFFVMHVISVIVGKREPHIDNILIARSNIKVSTKNIIKEKGNKFIA